MKSRIAIDLEFSGLHADATVISIALFSDCGKTFYAEFNDFDIDQTERMGCKEAVFSGLQYLGDKSCGMYQNDFQDYYLKDNKEFIAKKMVEWFSKFEDIEIVGDVLAYDWVLFCDLFGGAFSIPKNVYYIPFDIANAFKIAGIDPDISRIEYLGGFDSLGFEYKPHNALTDAKVALSCYFKLMDRLSVAK